MEMADYTLYHMPTPNGQKISLALEEMGASYNMEIVDFRTGANYTPHFLAVNPNAKIPALVDHTAEGGDFAIFESGAILEYLAEKTGKFMPGVVNPRARYEVKQWLYWQMAGFGPMLGQNNFFWKYSKDDVPVAKERFLKETVRLFGVLDERLAKNKYIAGEEYSIADMACYWWSLEPIKLDGAKDKLAEFKNVIRWQEDVGARKAVDKVKNMEFDI